ncbi:hypothetical protein K0A96_02350, partial [Patescibacteria group bacterium]|nr:hypothetical protein [Patescibacteria group bacterium]
NSWRQARISSTEYLTGIVSIGGSQLSWHSGALRKDGTLFMAGDNYSGQFGLGFKNSTRNAYFIPVKSDVKKFHISYYHSLALDHRNDVWGAGSNRSGQLGLGTLTEQLSWRIIKKSISDIQAGADLSLLLDFNSRVWGSGEGHLIGIGWSSSDVFVDTGAMEVTDFSAAWGGSNLVKKDGSYFATGDNSDQALGVNNPDRWCCVVWTENPKLKL